MIDPLDWNGQGQLLPVKPPPQIPASIASVFGITFGTPGQATFVNRFLDIRSRRLGVSQGKLQTKDIYFRGSWKMGKTIQWQMVPSSVNPKNRLKLKVSRFLG